MNRLQGIRLCLAQGIPVGNASVSWLLSEVERLQRMVEASDAQRVRHLERALIAEQREAQYWRMKAEEYES